MYTVHGRRAVWTPPCSAVRCSKDRRWTATAFANVALWAGGRAADVSFPVSSPLATQVGIVLVVLTTLLAFAVGSGCLRWPLGVPAGGFAPCSSQPPCLPWSRQALPCRPRTTPRPARSWRRCTWSLAPPSWLPRRG